MAANRRVVAEHFVFYNWLSTANGIEEVRLMICNGVVIVWGGERLYFLIDVEI